MCLHMCLHSAQDSFSRSPLNCRRALPLLAFAERPQGTHSRLCLMHASNFSHGDSKLAGASALIRTLAFIYTWPQLVWP